MENELLYGVAYPMSDEAQSKDFVLPIGKAKIERTGTDVTIIAFSKMVRAATAAAACVCPCLASRASCPPIVGLARARRDRRCRRRNAGGE
jgi:hypothetical protein